MAGLVITGGRVVDPASGMDAVGDVAVLDGQIAAVGTGLGSAEFHPRSQAEPCRR